MYEIGAEKGKYYSLNVPLKDGIDDQSRSCDPSKSCDNHMTSPLPLSLFFYLKKSRLRDLVQASDSVSDGLLSSNLYRSAVWGRLTRL